MKKPKENIPHLLTMGFSIALFSLLVFLRREPQLVPEVICQQLPGIICMSIFFVCTVIVGGTVMYHLLPFLGSKEVGAWLDRLAYRLTERLRSRTAASNYPLLQQFLYRVLSLNKETLCLPLGQDATCFTPRGQLTEYRAEQVFYRFELVMPEQPSMDCTTLRQILQSYVWSELRNHGIAGLYCGFADPAYGTIPSVYVDRVSFDDGAHLLQIDLLYIDNPDASKYAVDAYQRDKGTVQPEQEVFDDELG